LKVKFDSESEVHAINHLLDFQNKCKSHKVVIENEKCKNCPHFQRSDKESVQGFIDQIYSHLEAVHGDVPSCTSKL
jgi:hypothetical protein